MNDAEFMEDYLAETPAKEDRVEAWLSRVIDMLLRLFWISVALTCAAFTLILILLTLRFMWWVVAG
jgi:hypothetical protein